MNSLPRLFLFVLFLSACGPVTPISTDVLPTSVPQEYQDFSYYLSWSPDNKLLSVTTNTGLYVYDAQTFKQLAAFSGLSGSTVAFANGYMSAIDGDAMYVWNLKDYSLLFQEKSNDPIQFQSISISP